MGVSNKPLLSGPIGRPLRLASIGECMVELAPSGVPGGFQQSFAGDSFNTLWYLRQIAPDWQAGYVSRVGTDQMSRDMLGMFGRAGVDSDYVATDTARTVGLYIISLKDGERSFSYWRGQSAARHLADDPSWLAAALGDMDVVFFSGITLAILSPDARGTLLRTLAEARAGGATIVFDPNLRPRLWEDADTMRNGIMRGAGVSDIVLPSFDEEAEHFGDVDAAATCVRYLAQSASSVIVKNADGPVSYHHCGAVGSVTPDAVPELVDTTSAGDGFNAGLLAGLGRFNGIEEAIAMGARLAGQVIGQKGALCTLDVSAVLSGQRREG